MDLRRLRADRRLPAGGRVRRRRLPRPVRPADPGEVDAHRPLEAPARSASGASGTSASGSSRRWSAPTRCVLFAPASPLYVLYLRALGAKIGRGVAIFSRHVPVCTDLLTIGDGHGHPQGRVLHLLPGPRRRDPDRRGHPRQGRVRRRGDRARHRAPRWATGPSSATASSLHAGQAVPGGRALARVAGAARPRWTTGRSTRRLRHRCGGSSTALVAAAEHRAR